MPDLYMAKGTQLVHELLALYFVALVMGKSSCLPLNPPER
jgi:hypothetical protein